MEEERITPEVIYKSVAAYCRGVGINGLTEYVEEHWIGVCNHATALIAADYRYNDPSPFKVVAAVALAIAKLAPIPAKGVSDIVFSSQGIETIEDYNCPRLLPSLAGARIAFKWLINAEVGPFDERTGKGRQLTNEIKVSIHYLKDLAHTISKTARSEAPSIGSLSLIFEALAYKFNHWAEDDCN